MKRWLVSLAVMIVVLGIGIYWGRVFFIRQVFAPVKDAGQAQQTSGASTETSRLSIEIVAQDLEIPWEVAWLQTGEMLVTERPGRLLKIGADKSIIEIAGVAHEGEGGLLGLALHPNFSENQRLYLYLTSRQGGRLNNRVERYKLQGAQLTDRAVIIDDIPGAQFHDGGRIAFGPDGFLYVTTGDAGNAKLAQDIDSLAGKILRVDENGEIPSSNPFGSAVYSYGHRNPQGLAWDEAGQLWATEHGRSGLQSGLDEINLILKGANYGWPVVEGDETKEGMQPPVLHSGTEVTWAPAGAAVLDRQVYFSGLRGEALYSVPILEGGLLGEAIAHLQQEFGRLRGVRVGPDGWLYITTSNRDGRGKVRLNDDKIIRVDPNLLH